MAPRGSPVFLDRGMGLCPLAEEDGSSSFVGWLYRLE